MTNAKQKDIYSELGVQPVINGRGPQTVLGASVLSPRVLAAMTAANRHFVDMGELLTRTGEIIAQMLRCEAAYVTPGCAAAIALGTAACIARDDPSKIAKIPHTNGMPNEVLVQKRHVIGSSGFNKYVRLVSVGGGQLVEVGDESGTSEAQLEAGFGPNTAAVYVLHSKAFREGAVPLADVAAIAHEHEVPVLVDAAGSVYPHEEMEEPMQQGGDLVGYGAKYFGAPNSTGLLCGRRDLVRSAARQGFIGFEHGNGDAFGRAFKIDRQEVVAVVEALREWRSMDHTKRIQHGIAQAKSLVDALNGTTGLTASVNSEAQRAEVYLDSNPSHTADSVAVALASGKPRIWARVEIMGNTGGVIQDQVGHIENGTRFLAFFGATLLKGEPEIVADRLREIVSG